MINLTLRTRRLGVIAAATILLVAAPLMAGAQTPKELLGQKTGPMAKCGPHLTRLYEQQTQLPTKRGAGAELEAMGRLMQVVDRYVAIDAVARSSARVLERELRKLGMKNPARYGKVVSGWFPIDKMEELAACGALQFARPALASTNVGLVTSRGDQTQRSDLLRGAEVDDDEIEIEIEDHENGDDDPRLDGSGFIVGTLSDSFDCLGGAADDVASGDLPAGITVLEEGPCPASDEGRGISQIIADVAPGADQAFHTAFGGQANFANGIIELATVAGADVIVDDAFYFDEPMFQDGIIAQAVDTVKQMGVAYFTSAGNQSTDAYEAEFQDSGETGFFGGVRHDFDPGPGIDDLQTFTVAPGDFVIFSYQWDQPFFSVSGAPGSASDVDILFYNEDGDLLPFFNGQLLVFQGFGPNIGGDPVEVGAVVNFTGTPIDVQIGLEVFQGPLPNLHKYVFDGDVPASGVVEFDTASGSIYGHGNAAGAEAIGANVWYNHPLFNANLDEPLINSFSSTGPTPILFDTAGNRLAEPEVRLKPEIVAPDGVNTTFFGFDIPASIGAPGEPDGFPNFFGTSAAAPHAAAVAALLLQARTLDDDRPLPKPDEIYSAMEATAVDMTFDPLYPDVVEGFDFRTGFGFIDAVAAAQAIVAEEDDDDDDDDDD